MSKFTVHVVDVHVNVYEVEAASETDAKKLTEDVVNHNSDSPAATFKGAHSTTTVVVPKIKQA